jgi:rubrerythrin
MAAAAVFLERREAMKNVPVPDFYLTQPDMVLPQPPEIPEMERLLNQFENHETQERDFLREYKTVSAEVEDPLVKFLLQLIISDEEKHHAVTHAMVSTLKGDLNWTKPDDAIRGLYELGEERKKLLAVTEEFIRAEKDGILECKNLTKVSRRYYKGLFALLFKCMIDDSKKHVEILQFLKNKLKET